MKYFTDMSTIRRMETTADGLYKNREIRGFCHLCNGQEAIPVGMEASLDYKDALITAYRVHGNAYGRGESVHDILAEMMGRRSGSSKGKGGSMHYYNEATRFYGGNGIVGAQIPVGTGIAFAQKYRKEKSVTCVMYGDGAANQGQVFEAINMAIIWKLPAIYICENNNYGMGTSAARIAGNPEFYKRHKPAPGLRLDGMNVFAIREAIKFAKEYAVENGPICLEYDTYRYFGHSMSDPGISYREKSEVDEVRQTRDPIEYLKAIIIENNVASEKDIKDLNKKIKKEIDAIAEQVRKEPYPELSEMYEDILAPGDEHFVRGVEYKDSVVVNK